MSKTNTALAFEAGLNPFDNMPAYSQTLRGVTELAETMLRGRNPYFSKEYRDRFGIRVHSVEIILDRLALGIVESAHLAIDPDSQRHYRALIFRCDGNVMYHTAHNLGFADVHAARVDLTYNEGLFDSGAVLVDLLTKQIKDCQSTITKSERILRIVNKQGP